MFELMYLIALPESVPAGSVRTLWLNDMVFHAKKKL